MKLGSGCPKCGGVNSKNCDVCSGSGSRLRRAVMLAPLLLLLAACDDHPNCPPAPHDIWGLLNDWGFGIFVVLFLLIEAWKYRGRACKNCGGDNHPDEDDE